MSGIVGLSPNMKSGVLGKFPSGHVLQVGAGSIRARITTNSTTPATTGLAVAITPKDATNKVLVTVNIGSVSHETENERVFVDVDGCTSPSRGDSGTGEECAACWSGHRDDWDQGGLSFSILDSPATTSAVTYTLRYWTNNGYAVINAAYGDHVYVGLTITSMTLMEIQG